MNTEEKDIRNPILVPILRWLTAAWIVAKLTSVIIITANVPAGKISSAYFFDGLAMLIIVAVLIYSLSFLLPLAANTNTIFNIPIVALLRYSILAVVVLGILNLILTAAASGVIQGSAAATKLYFDNVTWTVLAVIIFYVFSMLIEARNLPDVVKTKPADSASKQEPADKT